LALHKKTITSKRSRNRQAPIVVPSPPKQPPSHKPSVGAEPTAIYGLSAAPPERLPITLHRYFTTLRHRWWMLVIIPLLTGALAAGVMAQRTPTYTAHATLLVNPSASSGTVLPNDVMAANLLARTYSELVSMPPVLDRANQRLGVKEDLDQLAKRVKARAVPNTQLIQIEASDIDPQRAADLANTIGSEFSVWIAESQGAMIDASMQAIQARIDQAEHNMDQTMIELARLQGLQKRTAEEHAQLEQLTALRARQLSGYTSLIDTRQRFDLARSSAQDRLSLASMAQPPLEPAGLQPWLVTLLASALGLALAFALVVVVEQLTWLVRTPSDLQGTSLPVLASIPRARRKLAVTMLNEPDAPVSEAVRLLRARMQLATNADGARTLVLTSSAPGEGKSLVAVNLAIACAQAGQRVLLIDGNLHHPRQHTLLNRPQQPGIADLLIDEALQPSDLLVDTDVAGLRLLPAGTLPSTPGALLANGRLRHLLDSLRESADFLVIDSPSLHTSADVLLLAAVADECVVVAGAGRTRLTQLHATIAAIRSTPVQLLGVVLNGTSRRGYAV
jgi:polysaccharide biosynthesis transport protein